MGATKSGVEHDLLDGFLKASSLAILSVDIDGSKGLPVRLDCGPEAIIQAVTHEVVGKVARAIICWHENVSQETDHVIHSGTNQAAGVL